MAAAVTVGRHIARPRRGRSLEANQGCRAVYGACLGQAGAANKEGQACCAAAGARQMCHGAHPTHTGFMPASIIRTTRKNMPDRWLQHRCRDRALQTCAAESLMRSFSVSSLSRRRPGAGDPKRAPLMRALAAGTHLVTSPVSLVSSWSPCRPTTTCRFSHTKRHAHIRCLPGRWALQSTKWLALPTCCYPSAVRGTPMPATLQRPATLRPLTRKA